MSKENLLPINKETKQIIEQVRKDINEVFMGDTLLDTFDQFTVSSDIIIGKKYEKFCKFSNRLSAPFKKKDLRLSLLIERNTDTARLSIWNFSAEYLSKQESLYFGEIAEFISGQGKFMERDIIKTTFHGLALPSPESDAVLDICKFLSQTTLKKYYFNPSQFSDELPEENK